MSRGRYRVGHRARSVSVRPRGDEEETQQQEMPAIYPLTIYSDQLPDEEFVDMGLVDALGEPILVRCREPIGYLHEYLPEGEE